MKFTSQTRKRVWESSSAICKGSLFVVKKSDNSIHIKLEGKVDGTDKGAVYDLGFLYEGEMKVIKE